jgi:hypothetical protein
MRGKAFLFFLLCSLVFAPSVRAGSLTTLDGKSYQGSLKFDSAGALEITPKSAAAVQVELANVLHATFASDERPLLRGVLLTSGEAIAADAITKFDADGVRLVRPGGIAVPIAAADLAIVFFRPVTGEALKRIPPGHAGAVLDNGDFFEGDPAGFNGSQLTISSVLFGNQTFDVNSKLRAVILQDAVAPDADLIVHLLDGSVLLAKSISISDGRLTIDDAKLGSIIVESQNVLSIGRGSSAFDILSTMTPTKVDGSPVGYAADATTAGVPMMLFGTVPAHGIGQRPGVSLSWDVTGKYKSVIAKAGVPLAIVPTQRLQFVVLTDGKEVFRSPPRTSIDDPAAVGVNLTGVKTLTFRVEGADALAPGAVGLWADPILIRSKS